MRCRHTSLMSVSILARTNYAVQYAAVVFLQRIKLISCPANLHLNIGDMPQLSAANCISQYVNVTSFLVGNIYVVAGPCRWFSPFVVAMGTLQWTCWNTLFLSFMVRLLNIVLYALRRIAALNRLPLSLCLSEK
jgi:hypothetical protein